VVVGYVEAIRSDSQNIIRTGKQLPFNGAQMVQPSFADIEHFDPVGTGPSRRAAGRTSEETKAIPVTPVPAL